MKGKQKLLHFHEKSNPASYSLFPDSLSLCTASFPGWVVKSGLGSESSGRRMLCGFQPGPPPSLLGGNVWFLLFLLPVLSGMWKNDIRERLRAT